MQEGRSGGAGRERAAAAGGRDGGGRVLAVDGGRRERGGQLRAVTVRDARSPDASERAQPAPPLRNGPHDLGGVSGFGAVDATPDAAAYPEGWEGRCIGAIIATMARGAYNVDEFRARIEELPPAAHFAMGYYRRWFHSLERNLELHGLLTREEIAARAEAIAQAGESGIAVGEQPDPAFMEAVETLLRDGGPLLRELPAPPRFAVGDRVRTRRIVVERLGEQHTRLPGYAQERPGTIERVHPPMTLPDASVGGEDRADHLYAVGFAASDLWPDADPAARVSADLFESYLAPEEA